MDCLKDTGSTPVASTTLSMSGLYLYKSKSGNKTGNTSANVIWWAMNQKLPESLWREIRHEYQTRKTTCRDLALKYGINRETVASRCKLEKWRCRRMEGETQRRETFSHLGCEPQVVPVPQQFTHRIMGEAALWLDRIQEAYETEVRYDRIEAIQKLLPQWKTVVDQARKGMEAAQEPYARPSLTIDLTLLSSPPALPPLATHQPMLTA